MLSKQILIPLAVAAMTLSVWAPLLAQNRTYKVLATNKTSTMQKEMQESGDAGYRFVAVMGGETAGGGKEAGDAGFAVVGQTVFESAFGGKETAAILQKGGTASGRSEYKLVVIARKPK